MAGIDTPLTFTVRRRAPELIFPAEPTPRELKPLSDIDDQEGLRILMPVILVYRSNPKMRNKNPASVIREALAKLLVFYYLLAGRLKEGPTGKLMVDCSGEGVLFIEAEADVTLNQIEDALPPPLLCMDELVYDVPGSSGILDSPLLLIQVTRMLCGGFIFAIRFNHTMIDGAGLVQFLSGLDELARGATSPSILPMWQRELLCSSDQLPITYTKGTPDDMVHKSLFFTTTEISALHWPNPPHTLEDRNYVQQSCTTFEVLLACLWRCRTISLQPNPEDEMPIVWALNARKMFNPPLPVGYYGNVLAFPAANATARDLCNKPFGHALEVVMRNKSDIPKDYIRSVSELKAIYGRNHYAGIRPYIVSDLTRARFEEVDFGWGKATYGGVCKGGVAVIQDLTSFYMPYTNNKEESGIVILIWLPNGVMDKFVKEINMLAQGKNNEVLLEHELPALSKI